MAGSQGAVRPLLWPVVAEAFVALAAVGIAASGLLPVETTVVSTAAGYVLGAVVVVVLAAVYRSARHARRANPNYDATAGKRLDRLSVVFMIVGLAGGLLSAFLLATELAK